MPGEVVSIDGLNDGFTPAVEECQGRLNEQNFDEGALIATSTGTVPEGHFVSTVRIEDDVWEWVKTTSATGAGGATRGAVLTPAYEGVNNYLSWVATDFRDASVVGWLGSWPPGNSFAWTTIGEEVGSDLHAGPNPMRYETTLDESSTVWVMASLQAVSCDFSGKGPQFAIFVNGAMVSETQWGTGDPTNSPAGVYTNSLEESAAYFGSNGAGTFNPFQGFPVCVETIQEVPPGQLSIEVKCMAGGLSLKNVVGSRELVILFLGR